MNKYKIKVTHAFSEVIDVEAENKEEAREKAIQLLNVKNRQGNPIYEATVPPDNWPIVTEDEFQEILNKYKEDLENKKSSSTTL